MTIVGKDEALFYDVGAQHSYECQGCGFVFAAQHFRNDGADTCPVCVDVADAERRERDRIVAFIIDQWIGRDDDPYCVATGIAGEIQRGEHLPKPGADHG